MSEFDIIRHYFSRPQSGGVLGPGDDCALLPSAPGAWAISTDLLLEGRHFFSNVDPATLGHKVLAVNLSDLAAMGATPRGFVLGLGLPQVDSRWLAGFSSGLHALADEYACPLVGGDTTRSNHDISIAVTVFGEVDARRALRRDAAQDGDDIWVSGALGEADIALRLLQIQGESDQRVKRSSQSAHPTAGARPSLSGLPSHSPTACEQKLTESVASESELSQWLAALPEDHAAVLLSQTRERLERPLPRVALGRRLAGLAHAAIDISDGLLQDLGHILAASRCGAVVFAQDLPVGEALSGLPWSHALRAALGGGDVYELCFTAPPAVRQAIRQVGARLQLPLQRIGVITATQQLLVLSGTNLPSDDQACGKESGRASAGRPSAGRPLTNLPGGFDHFSIRND